VNRISLHDYNYNQTLPKIDQEVEEENESRVVASLPSETEETKETSMDLSALQNQLAASIDS